VVARLGGDEFSLLTPGFLQPEQVGSIAQQILEALAKPITILGREIHISASIGIAIYPDDGQSLEELSKHADIAMYQAKKNGKNQFQYFSHEMKTKALHRLSLIHDLHIALDEFSFQIHYQPKIRLVDNKIIGMEALIRWTKPNGEIIAPTDFIPCAEETGMIIPIGDWVLTEACHQTKVWNRQFNAQLHIAVNLSARQFHRHNITDRVLTILEAHTLSPRLLELEITESILMNDVEEAIQVMAALRSHGISIAIDDFGTGFSSLSYLKRFPINTLKIDKSFIRDLTEESKDAAIIRSIITLAESLNLEVVAEGVETVEQLTFLSQQQCNIAQGYHLAKPMPSDEFERFLCSNSDRLI
jgi:EAL domain-containing protein (putative c-di-GMP-specific phosphodiesterase class I)